MGNVGEPGRKPRNEEILKEVKVEPIAMVMRRRMLEWFGRVKRRDETENTRAVVKMKMEGKRPRGRPKQSQYKSSRISWNSPNANWLERAVIGRY